MPRAKKTTAAKPETVEAEATITAYKGFDADLSCRGFRFELGGTYRHDGKVAACESGFHACAHPLDVFRHYPPATSRYAVVELGGETARHHEDSKIAAAEITIRAEIRLPDMIAAAVKYVFDRATWISGHFAEGEREGVKQTKHGGAATASGWRGAATASGWRGAATASGRWGAATASGDGGAATASGDWGAATASGSWGAATASGTRGAATASGWRGAATASGYQGAATASGEQGAATATGYEGKARGANGCALFLVERAANGDILHVWGGIAGRDGVEPDTFYRLAGGKPVAVE